MGYVIASLVGAGAAFYFRAYVKHGLDVVAAFISKL